MLKTLTLRSAQGIGVVLITAAVALAIPRWARPDLYPEEQGWSGLAEAMRRAFLHFDLGVACGWPGCPTVAEMWSLGYAADIWMLFGTVAIGVGGGFTLGLWCAARSGTRRARYVENAASFLYCAPVYVIALGSLLLFNGTFGLVRVPYFFDALPIWSSPFESPWDWLRTMLVPWLVAAAPLAAMCLRVVVALVREQLEADPVRTAIAKGIPHKRVIRRHAGPYAHAAVASLVGLSAPIAVTNLILVEHCFSVPGFFQKTWRASGHSDNRRWQPFIDYEMLVAISIWASLFVVVLSFAMEFALLRLDPRIRTAQRV